MQTKVRGTARGRITRPVVHYVKEWRTYRKLSLAKLSAQSGVSQSMISQLERGKTTYTQTTLEALAKPLDVEPWQLLVCREPGEIADLWKTIVNLDTSARRIVLSKLAEQKPPQSKENGTRARKRTSRKS